MCQLLLGSKDNGEWLLEPVDFGEFSQLKDLLTKIGERLMGDFDGDGLPDLLIQTQLGHEILVSRNAAKNYRIGVKLSGSKYTVKDINADQRTDLYNASSGEVHYAQQTGLSHAINVNDYVGSLSAESNISPSGEFTYSVPITMSESTGGFKPEFSFDYTSGGRNGPLGVGWSISGLDSVVRCEKNMEVDGESEKVNFTSRDRFCMNGQRLLVKSGHSYGSNNSEYRLQQDDGQKIVSHTTSSTKGPNGFTVFDTEGNKYYFGKYGSTNDAVIKTTDGKYFAWALKRVEDASGNYYQYKYEQQAGSLEYRVKEINYSGNGSSSTHNKMVFEWETRNDTSKVSYIHGQKNTLSKRLKSLKTYYSNRLVREYKLTYQYESLYLANSSASKLVSIQACNGANNCLSPTVFSWTQRKLGPNQLRYIDTRDYSHNSRYKSHKMLDFNGDGLMDIAYVRNDRGSSSDHLYMIPNTGGGLGDEKRIYDIATKTFRRSWKIVDYDRDGKDDILFAHHTGNSNYQWKVFRHISGNTFSSDPITGAAPSSTESSSRFADITGDGYQDLLHISDNKMVVQKGLRTVGVSGVEQQIIYELNKGSANRVTVVDYDKEDNSFPTADFNGDGRADFLVQVQATTYRPPKDDCLKAAGRPPEMCDLRKLQSVNNQLAKAIEQENKFASKAILPTKTSALERVDVTFKPSNSGFISANASEVEVAKFASPESTIQNTSSNTTWRILVSDGNRTLTEFANLGGIRDKEHTLLADVNGDGLTDFIYKNENDDKWYARINNGNGFNSAVYAAPDNNKNFIKVVDINGDGAQELYAEIDGKDYFYFYNGTGFTGQYFNSINSDYDYVDWTDLNGDGAPDRLKFSGRSDMWISYDTGEPRITTVTNGFGAETRISYTTLTNSYIYTPDNDANNYTWGNFGRVRDLKGAVRVASSFWKDQELLTYHYTGGKMQVGRGLLGYRQVAIESSKAKTKVVTTYRQDSIYRGSVISTETYVRPANYTVTPPGGDDDGDPEPPELCEIRPILCDCQYGNAKKFSSPASPNQCEINVFSSERSYGLASKGISSKSLMLQSTSTASSSGSWILKSSTTTEYDVKEQNNFKISKGGDVLTTATRVYPFETTTVTYNTDDNAGEILATQTKEIEIDDFGNILSKTVSIESPWGSSTEETLAQYPGPHYGGRKDFERITKTYTNKRNGQFISSDTKSFYTDYSYDSKGRLKSKLDDNGVLTEYLRNATYGLVHTESTSKAGLPTRSTIYGFDSTFRHVTSQTNSLGHRSTTNYDNLGRKNYVESANGQRTYSEYNHMGRLIAEIQTPANTISKTSSAAITKSMSQYWCQQVNHCPTEAVYFEETIAEGKPDARVYYDAYGRERRKSSAGLLANTWINVDTFYDHNGRKIGETVPHFSSSSSPEQSSIEYDGQNRVTKIIKADESEWATNYEGLSVTSINPNGAENKQLKNAMGLLVQVTDANNNSASYEYDANGKATKLEGPNGHPIHVQYDKYGNKRFLIDPDKGTIEYRYDDYFQLYWQKDARGVIVENKYDDIGRIIKTTRTLPTNKVEQDIDYVYDTGSYALGQLYQVKDNKSGYVNRFFYDAFSRKREQHTIIDGDTYSESWQFNNAGQLELETDATGQSVRYTYNTNKHLISLFDNQSHTNIWQANAIDALGNVTNETLGAGISRIKEFDVRTGMLTHLYSVGEEQLQSLDYHWDNLGNLEWRRDNAINKTETFEYDNLNRVRLSTISGGDTTEIRYDDSGNIIYKSGVGSYYYESGKPHAVTRVAGEMANNYQYDASGNMVQDNQRVLVYNSYDKPIYIGKDGYWMKFAYNHSGQRYKRTEFGSSKGMLIPILMGDITSWVPMAQETRYVGNVEFVRHGGTSTPSIW